jgi:hypothetical protein
MLFPGCYQNTHNLRGTRWAAEKNRLLLPFGPQCCVNSMQELDHFEVAILGGSF